jgi:hypothetical protein
MPSLLESSLEQLRDEAYRRGINIPFNRAITSKGDT